MYNLYPFLLDIIGCLWFASAEWGVCSFRPRHEDLSEARNVRCIFAAYCRKTSARYIRRSRLGDCFLFVETSHGLQTGFEEKSSHVWCHATTSFHVPTKCVFVTLASFRNCDAKSPTYSHISTVFVLDVRSRRQGYVASGTTCKSKLTAHFVLGIPRVSSPSEDWCTENYISSRSACGAGPPSYSPEFRSSLDFILWDAIILSHTCAEGQLHCEDCEWESLFVGTVLYSARRHIKHAAWPRFASHRVGFVCGCRRERCKK